MCLHKDPYSLESYFVQHRCQTYGLWATSSPQPHHLASSWPWVLSGPVHHMRCTWHQLQDLHSTWHPCRARLETRLYAKSSACGACSIQSGVGTTCSGCLDQPEQALELSCGDHDRPRRVWHPHWRAYGEEEQDREFFWSLCLHISLALLYARTACASA